MYSSVCSVLQYIVRCIVVCSITVQYSEVYSSVCSVLQYSIVRCIVVYVVYYSTV